MSKQNFDLLQSLRFEEAFMNANNEYLSTKSENALRERAIALLLLKNYEQALNDFIQLINVTRPELKGDGDFIYAGICYWLMNKPKEAISVWEQGLDKSIKYTTNIINIPSFLFFAYGTLQDKNVYSIAIKYLKRSWKNKVPIAGYLLNELSEKDLIDWGAKNEALKERWLCKVYFNIASHALGVGENEKYNEYLRKCIEIKGKYLEPEYFLAAGLLSKECN